MAEESTKTRKVFKIAQELKLTSQTVVDYLGSRGYNVTRQHMSDVDEEMYVELLKKFDKVKLQKYQAEQLASRDDGQKLDSARLREAEKQELLAVKDKPAEIVPEPVPAKKIELPKFRQIIVRKAPKSSPAAPPTPPDKTGIPSKETHKQKPAPKEEIPTPSTEQETVAKKTPAPAKELVTQIEPTEKVQIAQEIVKQPEIVEKTTPPTDKPPIKRKIELPKGMPLKIIEVAPPKVKKKLKRKRVAPSVESVVEDLDVPVEAKLVKEIPKPGKSKPVAKTTEQVSPSKRKRRKRKGGGTTSADLPQDKQPRITNRGKKTRKVDQQEVSATIKKTLALMDDHGKRRHRRDRSSTSSETTDTLSALKVTEFLTTSELASMMEVSVQELIKRCIEMGMIVSINQRLDHDLIELLAADFGIEIEFVKDEQIEEEAEEINPANQVARQPVVTVMGHVDHGKTTLLDYLRRTRVAEREAGGITQHIGAYEVDYNKNKITFLDTPGHEAFTAMRARGAQITDIVVLVVAADDRVMPQTLEAIDHARAAGVPIVVAINKVDKPTANPDAIYKQLADANILVEKWGGKYQSAEISAKFGQGIDDLLSEILVAAELLDLKADPTARARATIVETRLDKGLGVVTTALVDSGTLKVGDPFVAGQHYGRIRMLLTETGTPLQTAGPAKPVQIIGFNGVPQAGDYLVVYTNEKEARDVALKRQQQHREMSMRQIRALTLDQMSKKMSQRELQELALVIKGDVHGSVEVLADALMRLSTSEVSVNIIHRGVGAVTESDILLAAASGAIVIGFHVHPNPQARELARNEGVEIRAYKIIHEVVDDVRKAMEGLLAPLKSERVIGQVEIRKVYRISRIGSVAGCYVLEGKITRNNRVRLLRDNVEIWAGDLSSLKRFKDDAREVLAGFECGISLSGYNDIQENDRLEVIEIVETSRKLESPV